LEFVNEKNVDLESMIQSNSKILKKSVSEREIKIKNLETQLS
jgi:hypothetical protein